MELPPQDERCPQGEEALGSRCGQYAEPDAWDTPSCLSQARDTPKIGSRGAAGDRRPRRDSSPQAASETTSHGAPRPPSTGDRGLHRRTPSFNLGSILKLRDGLPGCQEGPTGTWPNAARPATWSSEGPQAAHPHYHRASWGSPLRGGTPVQPQPQNITDIGATGSGCVWPLPGSHPEGQVLLGPYGAISLGGLSQEQPLRDPTALPSALRLAVLPWS